MRTVTITRQKSFVGCLGALRVYIEDPTGDLTINGTACRLLGFLNNGKTEVFYIDEEAHRLFFIFDKTSRNYCNEFTDITAGPENIELTGKNHYNPAAGNPFRLDGPASAEVLENRRRGTRKGILVFIGAILVGLAIAFLIGILPSILAGQPETFTDKGMSITLNKAFDADPTEGFDVYYHSYDMDVMGERETFTPGDEVSKITVDEYCAFVIETFEENTTPQHKDGLTCFEYEYRGFRFLVVIYKTDSAFWTLQFSTDAEEFDKFRPTLVEYAKSVTFE